MINLQNPEIFKCDHNKWWTIAKILFKSLLLDSLKINIIVFLRNFPKFWGFILAKNQKIWMICLTRNKLKTLSVPLITIFWPIRSPNSSQNQIWMSAQTNWELPVILLTTMLLIRSRKKMKMIWNMVLTMSHKRIRFKLRVGSQLNKNMLH